MGFAGNILKNEKENDEWRTPTELFKALDAEFHFTLDPCATDQNHKCKKYFTKEDDGLKQDWDGETVFCNPPYGRNTKAWVEKCYNTKTDTAVVMLIPSRTETGYFHDYILGKGEIRFIRGRLHYNDAKNTAPWGSMIVIYRPGHK